MLAYISISEIAAKIECEYKRTKEYPGTGNIVAELLKEGKFSYENPNHSVIEKLSMMSEDEFLKNRLQVCIEQDTEYVRDRTDESICTGNLQENTKGHVADVFMEMVFHHEASHMHQMDRFFEMDYVYSGTARFYTQNGVISLNSGDMVIISPRMKHNIRVDDSNTFLIQWLLDHKSFYSAFISLLSGKNIISNFFKEILLNEDNANYLLLSTGNEPRIRSIARALYMEQFQFDAYSPQCSTDWLRLFFGYVLRSGRNEYRFDTPGNKIDFVPVLDYISVHYRTATLQEIAEKFHYSISYLSSSVKELTGRTYSDIVRERRLDDARKYLEESDRSIGQIASLAGYGTSDRFTRAFKKMYGMPPLKYRKQKKKDK